MARKKNARAAALLVAGALLAGGCSGGGSGEVGQLRRENDELRARVDQLEQEARQLRGQPPTPDQVYAFFANDPREGSLAGLFPGDYLESARSRYGRENRARSWTSEGRVIFQYEWDLVGGIVVRVNTNREQRLERVAVVLDGRQPVSLPTLAGLTIGKETYGSLGKRFPNLLVTALQLWGAQGHYTVVQTLPLSDTRRLEFTYAMPPETPRAELDRLEREVRAGNLTVLEPHLRDRVPFSFALEEIQ
jgi:outer membrane murein-binding lipoprotein Lpp